MAADNAPLPTVGLQAQTLAVLKEVEVVRLCKDIRIYLVYLVKDIYTKLQ